MISRIYRYNHTNVIKANSCISHSCDIKINNIEKYFIIQMSDYYNKINNDTDYKNKVDLIEEKLSQLKTEYNYLSNIANSMEKTFTNIKPYMESSGINYSNIRIQEKHNQAKSVLRSIKKQIRYLYGFLYHPLIHCIRSIAKYHNYKFCVQSNKCTLKLANDGKLYVLSNILLFIFDNCDINILGYDQFNNWNVTNIFAHPIISVVDDQIDTNVMLNKPFFSNIISPRWLPIIVDNTLQDLQSSYYVSLIQDLIFIVNILAIKNVQFQFQTIFRIDEIGFLLYSYLIGDLKTKELLCLFYKSKNIRKQKFMELSNH